MKRLLLVVTPLAIASLVLPSGARPAYACFCGGSLAENVDSAEVIVLGSIVSLTESLKYRGNFQALVGVDRYLKGRGPRQIAVDDAGPGSCTVIHRDSVGKRFLLFLDGEEGRLTTHLCTGSLPLSGDLASEESIQRVVGEVQALTGPGSLPQTDSDDVPWLAVILATALGASALAASAFLLRRRLNRR